MYSTAAAFNNFNRTLGGNQARSYRREQDQMGGMLGMVVGLNVGLFAYAILEIAKT